jgi:hypothetical protein
MSSRTTPYDIERIAKYPDALQIYRIHASKFFQVRLFVERKYVRRSTKCVDRRDAIEFAKRFYDEIRIAQRLDFSVHADTFAACASHLIKHQASLVIIPERCIEKHGTEPFDVITVSHAHEVVAATGLHRLAVHQHPACRGRQFN